jgi:hypothetical protein
MRTPYRDTLGLPVVKEAEGPGCGPRSRRDSEIELLEPSTATTGGRFLARRGEGLHHVCSTVDVAASLRDLAARQVALLDASPRPGLAGRIAFSTRKPGRPRGVGYAGDGERSEPGAPASEARSSAAEPKETAATFQSLCLTEIAMNGGLRMLPLSAARSWCRLTKRGRRGWGPVPRR